MLSFCCISIHHTIALMFHHGRNNESALLSEGIEVRKNIKHVNCNAMLFLPIIPVSRSEVLMMLKTVFSTLTVAMRYEPANAKFFATDVSQR